MRIIKILFIGLLVLSVVVMLISLLFPSTVTVSRDITIKAPASVIHRELISPDSWAKWYPQLDTIPARIYKDENLKNGSTIQWKTNDVKNYRIVIREIDSFSVDVIFYTDEIQTMESRFLITTLDSDRNTRLQWKSLLQLGWKPWEKFSGIFAEKMLAPQMEIGLIKFRDYVQTSTN